MVLALVVAASTAAPAPAAASRGKAKVGAAAARARHAAGSVRRLAGAPRAGVRQLRTRWRAQRSFNAYVERNQPVAEIYAEEKERATVHVARRSVGLNLAAAGISLAVSFTTPIAALSGIIALVQAENQWRNQSSKLMKARGATLERARALAASDPSIENPDIAAWLAAGLVRRGDVPSHTAAPPDP